MEESRASKEMSYVWRERTSSEETRRRRPSASPEEILSAPSAPMSKQGDQEPGQADGARPKGVERKAKGKSSGGRLVRVRKKPAPKAHAPKGTGRHGRMGVHLSLPHGRFSRFC